MLTTYRSARDARRRGEQGFTLVEVMVVVLIIGILLAIGIPTFLGARSRAQDRAAQSNLRIGQTTSLIIFTDKGNFEDSTSAGMAAAEPQLTWIAANVASADDGEISVGPSTAFDEFGAAAMSDSGTCFFVRVRANGSTQYGSSTTAACNANTARTVTGTGW